MKINSRSMMVGLAFLFSGGTAAAPRLDAVTSIKPSQLRYIQTAEHEFHWLTQEQIRLLSRIQHSLNRCGGFIDKTHHVGISKLKNPWGNQAKSDAVIVPLLLPDRPLKQQTHTEVLLKELRIKSLEDIVISLSTEFHTRFYNSQQGVDSANWIQRKFSEFSNGRPDISIERFPHRFLQPSIIARIQGTKLPQERIILGAHQDSINWEDGGDLAKLRAPGADDDATGIATILEVFRVLAQSGFKPDRTIEFIAYAGEEMGLLGSQEIVDQYYVQKYKVGAVLQLDMTGFPGSGSNHLTLITDHTNKNLNAYLKRLLDEVVQFPYKESKCGYGCSDHASWSQMGYPAAFPFEASQGEHAQTIHSVRDTVVESKLDFQFAMQFAKLALVYAIELGKD